ncbi:MAG: TspO/MBR family protein [Acidobacteriota bacterium]
MRRLAPYAAWIFLCELAGALAAVATMPAIPTWYATLVKPAWTPPGWLFGPVWTILYALMGIAAARVWVRHRQTHAGRWSLALFVAQLVANATWSFLFFGLRSPALGLLDIGVLLGLLTALVVWWWRLDRTASLLLVPYLAWVTFAAALNGAIWRLNP